MREQARESISMRQLFTDNHKLHGEIKAIKEAIGKRKDMLTRDYRRIFENISPTSVDTLPCAELIAIINEFAPELRDRFDWVRGQLRRNWRAYEDVQGEAPLTFLQSIDAEFEPSGRFFSACLFAATTYDECVELLKHPLFRNVEMNIQNCSAMFRNVQLDARQRSSLHSHPRVRAAQLRQQHLTERAASQRYRSDRPRR